MAMGADAEQVAATLRDAAETHHQVYRIVDGTDPDWASWYADWLIRLSPLPGLLGFMPVRIELVYLLVLLDKGWRGGPGDRADRPLLGRVSRRLCTLRVPKTSSALVTRHVRTHEGRRPGDRADGCRGV